MSGLLSSRGLGALVNEQIGRWRANQKRGDTARSTPWPLVTVSREYGSLGATVGRMVAERLGFDMWDQELVHRIAEETGVTEQLLESLDEHARNAIEEVVSSMLAGPMTTEADYVHQVVRVVHTIQQHGRGVVVGRGAQFVLGADQALRVRVICPEPERIASYAERKGMDLRAAARVVTSTEKERRRFIHQHFAQDVAEPHHYDMIVNTGTMRLEHAAALVVRAYELRFGDPREEAGTARAPAV